MIWDILGYDSANHIGATHSKSKRQINDLALTCLFANKQTNNIACGQFFDYSILYNIHIVTIFVDNSNDWRILWKIILLAGSIKPNAQPISNLR